MEQIITKGENSGKQLEKILIENSIKKYMLVCSNSFGVLPIKKYFDEMEIPYIKFNDFTSNPLYEDVCKGVSIFNHEQCDCIVAVGGGSAIDVAKCIKLYCRLNQNVNYLEQEYTDNSVTLVAIPTTSGTGSESTMFAVIYYNGEKQTVTHGSIIPKYAILDHSMLKTLPIYQKKCTMLDALCQGIESMWSVNSTDESKEYAAKAISFIIENMDGYLRNTETGNEAVMLAANYSGRAINITQTTAAHAMSYKLTSMYKLPHGHAVAICLPKIWRYMNDRVKNKTRFYLKDTFKKIALCLGYNHVDNAICAFEQMMDRLEMVSPKMQNNNDLDMLVKSVNLERLKNNPIFLDESAIRELYVKILDLKQS